MNERGIRTSGPDIAREDVREKRSCETEECKGETVFLPSCHVPNKGDVGYGGESDTKGPKNLTKGIPSFCWVNVRTI